MSDGKAKPIGLHERLEDIHNEIVNTDFEGICDSVCYLDAETRDKCRAAAQRVIELCDEHQRLDSMQCDPDGASPSQGEQPIEPGQYQGG